MNSIAARVALLVAVAALGACAQVRPINDRAPVYSSSRAGTGQVEYGVVSAIDQVGAERQLSGGGAVLGGVTGAVIGRQFGGSRDGRALGTFLGAVAGVLLGNQIEKQQGGLRGGMVVSVQLDNGGQRSFEYAQTGDLRVGDRVRVEGNQIVRM